MELISIPDLRPNGVDGNNFIFNAVQILVPFIY